MILWDPIYLGGIELRNRAVMPAMGTGYASHQGEATDQLRAYLRVRAEGGAGLVITEVAAVDPLGKGYQSELGVYDDSFLPGLETLAASIKAGGCGGCTAAASCRPGNVRVRNWATTGCPKLAGKQDSSPGAKGA